MYKSLLILFLLPIFMKYNDTSHKLLYKCLAHDVMRSAGQFSHSYLSYRCKCIVDLSTYGKNFPNHSVNWHPTQIWTIYFPNAFKTSVNTVWENNQWNWHSNAEWWLKQWMRVTISRFICSQCEYSWTVCTYFP
jgi:hypothetical protein